MTTFNPHANRTSDGVVITVGLKVIDYDRQSGTVVSDRDNTPYRCCDNTDHVRKNDLSADRNTCEKYCNHDHWFDIKRDSGGTSMMNGSRLQSA